MQVATAHDADKLFDDCNPAHCFSGSAPKKRPLEVVFKQGATVAPLRSEQMKEEMPGNAVSVTRNVSASAARYPVSCMNKQVGKAMLYIFLTQPAHGLLHDNWAERRLYAECSLV